jgi:LysR family hydrogen peroxide-inducible transcriptional activator
MTLAELKYLVALATEKHFGKAAIACHVSQPTLSIAISKLEAKLGVCLFERMQGELRTTPVGEKIIAQARCVLEETVKIDDIIAQNKQQMDAPLNIGAIFTIAPYLFPLLIPRLNRLAPTLQLRIQEDYTANLKTKLKSGELDMILVALPFADPAIATMPLYCEPFVGLIRQDNPLAKKKQLSLTDLANEQVLLLGEGHCFRDAIVDICPDCYQKDSTQQTVQGTSLETLRHMVASGLGMTILPISATQVKHYSNLLCVKTFKEKKPKRDVALAWRKSYPQSKTIDVVIKAIKEIKLHGICLVAS